MNPGTKRGLGKPGPLASKYARAAAMLIRQRTTQKRLIPPTQQMNQQSPYAKIANGNITRPR